MTSHSDRDSGSFLVLGATGSTGSQLCRRLAREGHRVFAAGRNAETLREIASELDCPTAPVDANDPATIDEAVEQAHEVFGGLDGVANCIGSVMLKPAHRLTDDDWRETLTTNLTSAFATVRAAAKTMRKSGGSIVLVSSAAAQIGLPNHEAISAAKAGINGLVLAAAASYANRGIRVNAVAPGLVKSKMTRRLWESESAAESSRAMHALGRIGEPEEIAAAMSWLLDPSNSWVTGQILGVDGGLSRILPPQRL